MKASNILCSRAPSHGTDIQGKEYSYLGKMIDTLRRDTSPSLYFTSTGTISKGNKLLGLVDGRSFPGNQGVPIYSCKHFFLLECSQKSTTRITAQAE
ncbi:hypothetical protein D5086_002220 [Populus alba]|uniref:Uncharacterized protein n=1 Tax=Populus alba TaxID=43335 RepID=A0ACC4D233_POPAL